MATVKSGINKVGNNYYQSLTQEFSDGGVGTTLYRVDAQGNNGVPIYDVDKTSESPSLIKTFDPNATPEEQRLLSDPNSQLSQVRSQQVTSSNPNSTPDQQAALAQAGGGSGNTASATGTPDQQGGSTPTADAPQQPSQQASSAILKYPLKMDDRQDRIMFHAHEYKSGGRLSGGKFGELNPVQYTALSQRVFLPIQSSITDQNAVGWESDTLNPIETEAAKLSNSLMTVNTANSDIGTQAGKILTEALANAKTGSEVKGANQAVRTYLIGQAIGVNNLLSRLQGQVLNPNLELLFQGPQLRPFSFAFKLSPRSKEEAVVVKQIIRYFKKNMAVRKDNAIFLRAPNVFKIQYQYGAAEKVHQSLNLIKMCALTNCSVDYTPNGTYMTYSDPEATMVSYSISLSFQELTPIYDTDYETFDYGDGTTVSIPTQNSIGA
jgi:hypothetical protein